MGHGSRGGNARVIEIGPNFIARPYRGVSVQETGALDESALRAWLLGRRVYRRTEFIVAAHGEEHALVQVEREGGDEVLVPVRQVRLLAGPRDIAFVRDPTVDTGNASQMARAARASGRSARVYVVQGKFEHVNFIVAPAPLRVRVLEVVPPEPPKLLDMAQAVLDYDEDLPPVELEFEPIDLRALAAAHPAEHYLFPCRCSGLDVGARVDFLDAGPPEVAAWTLVGCERSRQIHAGLYGCEPRSRVDFCPRTVASGAGPTLIKCCRSERGIERAGSRMIVPWGATLEEVRQALRELAGIAA
jgi:hypothetical protein